MRRVELDGRDVATTAELAAMPIPLAWTPERRATEAYIRMREQASVQVEARTSGANVFDVLPHVAGFGLSRLPAPSPDDVFLDFESNPYVREHGPGYLLGYVPGPRLTVL